MAEELRKPGLHWNQVTSICLQQSRGRSGLHFGVGSETGAESLQVFEAKLLCDRQHLGLVFLYFVEANLVNLVCGQVGGCAVADQVLVVPCAIGQSRDAGLCAARRDIADLKKACEPHICGKDLFVDCVQHLRLDALLLRGGNRGGELFERESKRGIFWLLIGERLDLFECLLQEGILRGTRRSFMPIDMFVITWSNALGIACSREIQSS